MSRDEIVAKIVALTTAAPTTASTHRQHGGDAHRPRMLPPRLGHSDRIGVAEPARKSPPPLQS